MRHRMFFITAFLLVAMLILAGCGGRSDTAANDGSSSETSPGSSTSQTDESEKTSPVPLKMAVSGYDAYSIMIPLRIAEVKDFFAEEGIDIEIITTGGGGDTVRAVTTGGLDAAIAGADATISAIMAGEAITIVAPYIQTTDNAWVVPENSPIQSVEDLEGKTMGFTSPGSSTEFMAKAFIRATGIQAIPLRTGGDGDTWAAVKSGNVDAAWSIEPLTSLKVLNENARVIFWAHDYLPHFMMDTLSVHNDYLNQHPETIRGLLRAIQKGMDFLAENVDEAAQIGAEHLKVSEEVVKNSIANLPNKEVGLSLKVDPLAFKTIEEGMIEAGKITEPIRDWNQVFDQSYLDPDWRAEIPLN